MLVKRWQLCTDDFAVKLQSSDLTDLFQAGNPVDLERNQTSRNPVSQFDDLAIQSSWRDKGEHAVWHLVLTLFNMI